MSNVALLSIVFDNEDIYVTESWYLIDTYN